METGATPVLHRWSHSRRDFNCIVPAYSLSENSGAGFQPATPGFYRCVFLMFDIAKGRQDACPTTFSDRFFVKSAQAAAQCFVAWFLGCSIVC